MVTWLDARLLALAGRLQYGLACQLTRLAQAIGFQRSGHAMVDDIRSVSGLFRDPSLFPALAEYLKTRYPDGVPIYCYAAASGAEPYSIVMKLQEALGEAQAARYFPIEARELMPELVDFARHEGALYLAADDLQDYRRGGMRSPVRRFLRRDRSIQGRNRYEVLPGVREHVRFDLGDVLRDVQQPFPQPCVLLFRNGWYHIPSADAAWRFCLDLYRNLPPGSAVIVGAVYLEKHGYTRLLQDAGFVPHPGPAPWMQIHEKPLT